MLVGVRGVRVDRRGLGALLPPRIPAQWRRVPVVAVGLGVLRRQSAQTVWAESPLRSSPSLACAAKNNPPVFRPYSPRDEAAARSERALFSALRVVTVLAPVRLNPRGGGVGCPA
ncbi:MAG: hypothetical protein ACPGSM_12700 [Thiolinea sp.]